MLRREHDLSAVNQELLRRDPMVQQMINSAVEEALSQVQTVPREERRNWILSKIVGLSGSLLRSFPALLNPAAWAMTAIRTSSPLAPMFQMFGVIQLAGYIAGHPAVSALVGYGEGWSYLKTSSVMATNFVNEMLHQWDRDIRDTAFRFSQALYNAEQSTTLSPVVAIFQTAQQFFETFVPRREINAVTDSFKTGLATLAAMFNIELYQSTQHQPINPFTDLVLQILAVWWFGQTVRSIFSQRDPLEGIRVLRHQNVQTLSDTALKTRFRKARSLLTDLLRYERLFIDELQRRQMAPTAQTDSVRRKSAP